MDKLKTQQMDGAMVGPRLFCENCSMKEVLSPCWSCQYFCKDDIREVFCRGCGASALCKLEYDVCKANIKFLRLENMGKLPAEIGQLANLIYLNLEYNQLETLPAEIGQLTHLQGLYLNYNELKKLPPEIGQLTLLHTLYLDNNQLKELPAEIGQLASLQVLSIGMNPLSKLPAEIKQLTHLQTLEVDSNLLSDNAKQQLRSILPNTEIFEIMPPCGPLDTKQINQIE